ncbi:hypothetical protein F441_19731 [Phytophthora nicotianae CJ01A1]|uniref:HAT C-terminal dimerisation domain-containing protein n=1 Tax=Phytophthora nicotianae CJ01A1 TaxID=1317063 RepID=W2VY92_PHYNI|nr:hypothetical protein F441_19731 [Phytophthora nicotianae CJ01A1]
MSPPSRSWCCSWINGPRTLLILWCSAVRIARAPATSASRKKKVRSRKGGCCFATHTAPSFKLCMLQRMRYTRALERSLQLDLVPSVDDDDMQCGAPLTLEDAGRRSLSSLHQEADEVLDRWLSHNVPWVQVAVQQADDKGMTAEAMTGLLLGLFKHLDVCRWFKEVGAKQFPSVAVLARVWRGRVSSNAFQERVFSTGGLIMSSRRMSTDNERAETQVLLKQNRSEIKRMEPLGGSSLDRQCASLLTLSRATLVNYSIQI